MKRAIAALSLLIYLLAAVSVAQAAPIVSGTYDGTYDRDFGGGAAWSFGHTATNNPVTPSGGFEQYTSGVVPFAIDPTDGVSFAYSDVDASSSLNAGDTITFASSIVDIRDYLSPVTTGALTGDVGTLELNGTLTVGGAGTGSPSFAFGISGSLDFDIIFTAAPTRGGYSVGDTISGTTTFQNAHFVGQFNGIESNAPANDVISFAIWGDNRDGTGAINGTYSPVDSDPVEDYAFGLDIVIDGLFVGGVGGEVPEPSTYAMALTGLACLAGFRWRRKRQR